MRRRKLATSKEYFEEFCKELENDYGFQDLREDTGLSGLDAVREFAMLYPHDFWSHRVDPFIADEAPQSQWVEVRNYFEHVVKTK